MPSRLAALASLITCPRCRRAAWSLRGGEAEGALECQSCHTAYLWREGVLDLGALDEAPEVADEREGVRRTEHNAALGGINDEFDDLAHAHGALSFDNLRTPFPSEIGPGQHATLAVDITAPGEPGEYVAEIDLVHESMRWFASTGMASPRVPFRVSA